MKKLKLVQAGYKNYTGPIGAYEFVDGVSVDFLPQVERDRLAVAFEFVEVDTEGVENPAGIAHRLVSQGDTVAEILPVLDTQTEEEKLQELKDAADNVSRANITIYEKDDLQRIADKGGIKALREIAVLWNVKHRSIPVLIGMILDAQAASEAKLEELRVRKAEAEKALAPVAEESSVAPSGEVTLSNGIQNAAATGDLSAALNITEG